MKRVIKRVKFYLTVDIDKSDVVTQYIFYSMIFDTIIQTFIMSMFGASTVFVKTLNSPALLQELSIVFAIYRISAGVIRKVRLSLLTKVLKILLPIGIIITPFISKEFIYLWDVVTITLIWTIQDSMEKRYYDKYITKNTTLTEFFSHQQMLSGLIGIIASVIGSVIYTIHTWTIDDHVLVFKVVIETLLILTVLQILVRRYAVLKKYKNRRELLLSPIFFFSLCGYI